MRITYFLPEVTAAGGREKKNAQKWVDDASFDTAVVGRTAGIGLGWLMAHSTAPLQGTGQKSGGASDRCWEQGKENKARPFIYIYSYIYGTYL